MKELEIIPIEYGKSVLSEREIFQGGAEDKFRPIVYIQRDGFFIMKIARSFAFSHSLFPVNSVFSIKYDMPEARRTAQAECVTVCPRRRRPGKESYGQKAECAGATTRQ